MERVSLRSLFWVVIGHTSAQIWYVKKCNKAESVACRRIRYNEGRKHFARLSDEPLQIPDTSVQPFSFSQGGERTLASSRSSGAGG